MMEFLRPASKFSAASTRTKCVRQLGDREDAPAVQLLAFSLRYPGEQAELVLLRCQLTAARSEFALVAVAVLYKVGGRIAGQEGRNIRDALSHRPGERGERHPQRCGGVRTQ